jgi:hypothetical protein
MRPASSLSYRTENRKHLQLDTTWPPTSMYESMEDEGHALNKLTKPYQWLRREAISNLRAMQALGHWGDQGWHARKVLTPWQDEEPESSIGSDAEGQSPMQDTSTTSESEGGKGDDADRKKTELAEKPLCGPRASSAAGFGTPSARSRARRTSRAPLHHHLPVACTSQVLVHQLGESHGAPHTGAGVPTR